MAGRIQRADIDLVRERADIAEIVGAHVTLKPAGVGSLKGLCPFHDERTPSFHVRPQLGLWHCFGCNEGGDVISFVQRIDHVSFAEAVEFLAGKAGVQLHYEEGGGPARPGEEPGRRQRLLDAHRLAEEFYIAQLATPEAAPGRQFLAARGFGREAARHFGVGFAPAGWDGLLRHLRQANFTDAEILAAGLVSQGPRGIYDRFRGRLMWPIRDLTGATIGFGARKLLDDDPGPKYLNTPETPIYKKQQVLYGLDLAKRDIAAQRKLVVVEGYTDVMAAHLAGETTAVATCGTAFGEGHIRVARRLLGDSFDPAAGVMFSSGAIHGAEVIFTFDGDEAGRKAALRAFDQDQRFAAQTFVAIEPNGHDPCDVRRLGGDAAVRALIASRKPLFAFAIESVLAGLDTRTAEGRVAGLRAVAPVVARIRDRALRMEYAREAAGWLGMEEATVRAAVASAGRQAAGRLPGTGEEAGAQSAPPLPATFVPGGPGEDPVTRLERQVLEAILQFPTAAPDFDRLPPQAMLVPAYRALHEAVRAAGGVAAAEASGPRAWLASIKDYLEPELVGVLSTLVVNPLPVGNEQQAVAYARGLVAAFERTWLVRQIGDLRAAHRQLPPESAQALEVLAQVLELEARRRDLSEQN
ncbi:DNA primase [Buchananella hordeovulneris]|uniref:DNA primase n=1 Tax=Buchananella hordeovulneris TaxID=52770 RepID=UPI000F5DAC55|nr:DNA primase [Buchananella hordeovulneris]RRD45022.1 DNA primase [Buchananella hordeovulneris]